jgi:3-deoxy-D-arabino-heptulosonate 7-phosphate (DAHP) synthase class II
LPRGSTEERGEKAGENRRKKEKGREMINGKEKGKKERIKKGPNKLMKSYSSSSFVKSYCNI